MPNKKPPLPPHQTITKPDKQLHLPMALSVSEEVTSKSVGVSSCVKLKVICIGRSQVVKEHCRYAVGFRVDDLIGVGFTYQRMSGEVDLGW